MTAISTRDDAEFNPHFQVGLDVAGRRCLVIGGGAEAGDKTGRLLEAGAEVLVVAPELNRELREWAAAGRIRHRPRRYRRRDQRGAHLVLNTVRSDDALCRRVFAQARRWRIPINTFDLPRYSTLAMAALVSQGHLRISISTSNTAPALAGRLRRDLETILRAAVAAPAAAATAPSAQPPPTGSLRTAAAAAAAAADQSAAGSDASDPQPSAAGALAAGRTPSRPAAGARADTPPSVRRSAERDATGPGAAERPGLLARAGQTDGPSSELEQFLDGLGQVRSLAKRRVASAADRRTLLRGLVDEFRLTGVVHLPPAWRRRLAAVRTELERYPHPPAQTGDR